MKVLITGICGFVGSSLARFWHETSPDWDIFGIDNFIRPGSELNRPALERLGIKVTEGDLRFTSEVEALPAADFVIDAAAQPSVLAGVDGAMDSRELVGHNLIGTLNLLEYCKRVRSGLVVLSTSRVYSIPPLADLPIRLEDRAFVPDLNRVLPPGLSPEGIDESFSTQAPVSLYGATKLASETMALEYGATFDFPVFINRCGVLAGAGQFGRPDQGIFAYWLHAWKQRRALAYIGFDGQGHQVRDVLHAHDLARLVALQMAGAAGSAPRIVHVSGGAGQAMSLRQLSDWCAQRWGRHDVASRPQPRRFDLPWIVLDSSRARAAWGWQPTIPTEAILDEIGRHAEANPGWLDLSAP